MADEMRTVTCTAPVNIAVIKYCKLPLIRISHVRGHDKWEGLAGGVTRAHSRTIVQGASETRIWFYPSTRH